MMKLNGAQILIECLKEQGVDTVFGYPGSSVLKIYDELYRHKDEIRHILTSHEQGAAHAADGYARVTGKVGVCIATSGPGATNLVTGIANAYMDSVPLVAISCNVSSEMLGKDSFQEVDITGITMPITKHGMIIKEVGTLADTIRKAFRIASSGRPGPVVLDITKNVLSEETEFIPEDWKTEIEANPISTEALGWVGKTERFCTILEQAKKPLILAGGGAKHSDAGEEILLLSERLGAPIVTSLMGKGICDEARPEVLGMIGAYGTKAANQICDECDLILALGIRFSDRMMQKPLDETGRSKARFAQNAKIIQIDIDPAEINKNITVEDAIVGDVKNTLSLLLKQVKEKQRTVWFEHAKDLKQECIEDIKKEMTGQYLIERLYQLTGGHALITTEVGQHQMWAATGYPIREDGMFLTSGGLGTMGYGLSAAIGAKLARPDKKVINLAGDGCFRMNMNELLTASRHKIPIVQIVFDNQVLGLVYRWQKLEYEGRYSATEFCDRLDFVKLAEALGVKAYRITKVQEMDAVLSEALQQEEPVVIDCVIER